MLCRCIQFHLGMMTQNELEIFENIKTSSNKYYIPLVWATTLLSRARKENRITNDYALKDLLQVIHDPPPHCVPKTRIVYNLSAIA